MSDILRGTWVVAYRELLRFVRERSRLVGSLAMPLTFLVIFGVGFSGAIGQMAPGRLPQPIGRIVTRAFCPLSSRTVTWR